LVFREHIDCFLVSGDIFDSQAPPPDAERLVYDFFAKSVQARIPSVVIGGNHDHPRRLGALRQLLDPLQVFFRPEPARPSDSGVIQMERNGEKACIAVLPFVTERKIIDACHLMGPEESWYTEYAENVCCMFDKLSEAFSSNTVNLLMAHLYAFGAQTSGSERAVHVAQPYAISPARFPASAHYVALGHLHRPQEVASPSRAFYSGSPLQLDFGEQGQRKRVLIVEARPGRPASIESVDLSSGRRLRDVSGTLAELESAASTFGNDYLRVTVKASHPVPGLGERIRNMLPNAIDIKSEYPQTEVSQPTSASQNATPDQRFADFYRVEEGVDAPEDLMQLFQELYDEASHATD
jgi:DNA repair protein SbcD/Mre11